MPNTTANYSFYLPLVNDPVDQDLWGGYLNANWTSLDILLNTRTQNYSFADFQLIRPLLKDYGEVVQTVSSSAGTAAVDFTNGNHVAITLTENTTFTFANPSPTSNAAPYIFYIKQGGSGSYTATWPASVVWAGGAAPVLTTTVGRTDELVFITRDAGTKYTGSVRGLDFNV